ncbi:MAG: mono/diheme cytochrome c family protein [Brevundimonas sp.]|jgi:mono/diheme cytochrome c family protein|uniref:c-type cytochrome n=1 Tax=Brevundimonas sp. TaxID=1871086 RepID=UPI0024895724|nr:cytochrome c [Brevundimonas sp.]MDI1281428.1 cytochrome c [Brevundimonas sp.]
MSPVKFIALALLAGCTTAPMPATDAASPGAGSAIAVTDSSMGGSVARGAALVRTRCVACHAVGPVGDSPLAMAPPFRELGRRYPVSSLQESFAEGLVTAHPEMPEFTFEPEQVRDLIAYLESLEDTGRSAR